MWFYQLFECYVLQKKNATNRKTLRVSSLSTIPRSVCDMWSSPLRDSLTSNSLATTVRGSNGRKSSTRCLSSTLRRLRTHPNLLNRTASVTDVFTGTRMRKPSWICASTLYWTGPKSSNLPSWIFVVLSKYLLTLMRRRLPTFHFTRNRDGTATLKTWSVLRELQFHLRNSLFKDAGPFVSYCLKRSASFLQHTARHWVRYH